MGSKTGRLGRAVVVAVGVALVISSTVAAVGQGISGGSLAIGTASLDAVERVPLSTAGDKLTHDVFAFFHPHNMDHVETRADFDALSHIAYFAVSARAGGHLKKRSASGATERAWAVWNSRQMDRIINKAHAAGTKVILTVTRFGWRSTDATERLLSSAEARAKLAREIAAEMDRRGVDGVNIDFEPIPGSQEQNFVRFVRLLRSELDAVRPGYDLTVAATGFVANYDVAGLTAPGAANAIFIMAYHYRGSWSRTAGSIAPLTRPAYDVTDTVNRYLEEASPSEIILGVPYYGYVWSTETSGVRSETRPRGSTYGNPYSVTYATAVGLAQQHGRLWDAVEQGPWSRWQYRACGSCPLTWRQMYYEDRASLGRKYDLAKRKGLRGVGIWALGYERSSTQLNELLIEKFGAG